MESTSHSKSSSGEHGLLMGGVGDIEGVLYCGEGELVERDMDGVFDGWTVGILVEKEGERLGVPAMIEGGREGECEEEEEGELVDVS